MNNRQIELAPLNSGNISILRRSMTPSILLTGGLLALLTLINLAFHFMDVLTGVEVVERPPVIRLIIIEVLAFILSLTSFLYLTSKVRKDLAGGKKLLETGSVVRKFAQKENDQLVYRVKLDNQRIIDLEHILYTQIREGDMIKVVLAPNSEMVFEVSAE